MMATPLLLPSASSAKSAAAASATRASGAAAKSCDGGAWCNLGLLRPRRLLSAGASPPVCLSFAGWLLRRLLLRASASHHLLSRSRLTRPDDGNHLSIRCVCGRNHPRCTCGISSWAHCHHRCTRKNYHVNNKYKMELIYYPTPAARDALPMMAIPLLLPLASSTMSAAAASAARARAVAAKSRDGSAQRNFVLSRPCHLLPAGASPPICLSFAGWLSRCLLLRASALHHLLLRSRLTHPDDGDRLSIRCVHGCNHPRRTCGISHRAHCHHLCTRKNYHVNNKYKMELIYYPAPATRDALLTMATPIVAAIGMVRNECSCSLSREGQGGCRQVP
jgi:hypothetical protein